MGGALRDTPTYSYRDDVLKRWDVDALPRNVLVENPKLSGLFFQKNIISQVESDQLEEFIFSVCSFAPATGTSLYGPNQWTWYEFDEARYMAGCKPFDDSTAVSSTIQDAALQHFEGNTPMTYRTANTPILL